MSKVRFIVQQVHKLSNFMHGDTYDFSCINMHISHMQESFTGVKRFNWTEGNKIQLRRLINSSNVELISWEEMFAVVDEVKYVPTFFVVSIPEINSMFETNWVYWLTDDAKAFLRETNVPILLTQPGEFGFEWIESNEHMTSPTHLHTHFDNRLSVEGICNPIIIHDMSELYFDPNPPGRKYHSVYSTQWIEHVKISSENTQCLITYEQHLENINNKKIFFCSNRAPRELRCLLLLSLIKHNNLDKGNISFLCESPANVKLDLDQTMAYFDSLFNWMTIDPNEYSEYVDRALELLPIELDEDVNLRQDHVLTNATINTYRLNSLIEIVTETHDFTKESAKVAVLSEKAFWPIANQMPFIMLGHRRNNDLLHDLGFKTFEDDLIVPSAPTSSCYQRVEYINNVIKTFNNMTDNARFNWLNSDKLKEKIQHNYNHLFTTKWNEVEIQSLVNSFQQVFSAIN